MWYLHIFGKQGLTNFGTSGSLVFMRICHWGVGKLVNMHVLICGSPLLSSILFVSVTLSFLPSLCLPQKVIRQQQEINNLAQKRTTVDEDVALMKKELTSLREQLVNKDQELKVDGVNFPWQCGSLSLQVSFLCFTNQCYSPVILFVCFNCSRKKCCLALLNTVSKYVFMTFSFLSFLSWLFSSWNVSVRQGEMEGKESWFLTCR